MKIIFLLMTLLAISRVGVCDQNNNIGGNSSFNNNSGSITIHQTGNTNSEYAKSEKIINEKSLINSRDMKKNNPPDKQRDINARETLLSIAKKINEEKIPIKEKQDLCKQEAELTAELFKHKIEFSYKDCNEIFQ